MSSVQANSASEILLLEARASFSAASTCWWGWDRLRSPDVPFSITAGSPLCRSPVTVWDKTWSRFDFGLHSSTLSDAPLLSAGSDPDLCLTCLSVFPCNCKPSSLSQECYNLDSATKPLSEHTSITLLAVRFCERAVISTALSRIVLVCE